MTAGCARRPRPTRASASAVTTAVLIQNSAESVM
jgi:hypothetical protein